MEQCLKKHQIECDGTLIIIFCTLEKGHAGNHSGSSYAFSWPKEKDEESINVELTGKVKVFLKYLESLNEFEKNDCVASAKHYIKQLHTERHAIIGQLQELHQWYVQRYAELES
jgi:hypothetical protein